LGAPPFSNVAENHHVLARQTIGFGCEFNENGGPTVSYKRCVPPKEFLRPKGLPSLLELTKILVEAVDGPADELASLCTDKLFRGGVGLSADCLIIQDENGI
jgi:hypothetical protein